jgi:hypothetical protein
VDARNKSGHDKTNFVTAPRDMPVIPVFISLFIRHAEHAPLYVHLLNAKKAASAKQPKAATWFQRMVSPKYKTAKTAKTLTVMISWMVLSWAAE